VNRATPGLFWPILLPGLLLGAGIVMTLPLLDTIKRGRTSYQITPAQIIIRQGRARKAFHIPPADQLILRDGPPPTVTFGRARNNRPISLERIADGTKVHAMLQQLARERHDA